MIEEQARVVERHGDRIRVEVERQSTCGQCSARHGCGTEVLSRYLGRRSVRLELDDTTGAEPGDRVVLGIAEAALVSGSAAVYLAPLAALAAAGLAGETLAGEPGAILGGLAGLVAGLFWLRRHGQRLARDQRLMPVVLRRLSDREAPLQFHSTS
ncbi:MAG: SoxR reducing system RseC family protein [Thiohalospira sp.]